MFNVVCFSLFNETKNLKIYNGLYIEKDFSLDLCLDETNKSKITAVIDYSIKKVLTPKRFIEDVNI